MDEEGIIIILGNLEAGQFNDRVMSREVRVVKQFNVRQGDGAERRSRVRRASRSVCPAQLPRTQMERVPYPSTTISPCDGANLGGSSLEDACPPLASSFLTKRVTAGQHGLPVLRTRALIFRSEHAMIDMWALTIIIVWSSVDAPSVQSVIIECSKSTFSPSAAWIVTMRITQFKT